MTVAVLPIGMLEFAVAMIVVVMSAPVEEDFIGTVTVVVLHSDVLDIGTVIVIVGAEVLVAVTVIVPQPEGHVLLGVIVMVIPGTSECVLVDVMTVVEVEGCCAGISTSTVTVGLPLIGTVTASCSVETAVPVELRVMVKVTGAAGEVVVAGLIAKVTPDSVLLPEGAGNEITVADRGAVTCTVTVGRGPAELVDDAVRVEDDVAIAGIDITRVGDTSVVSVVDEALMVAEEATGGIIGGVAVTDTVAAGTAILLEGEVVVVTIEDVKALSNTAGALLGATLAVPEAGAGELGLDGARVPAPGKPPFTLTVTVFVAAWLPVFGLVGVELIDDNALGSCTDAPPTEPKVVVDATGLLGVAGEA